AAASAEAHRRQEAQQRATEVRQKVADSRSALAAHNLEAAGRDLDAAAKLAPEDPEVAHAREDLLKAQQAVRAEADARQKRQDDYQLFLKSGREALAGGRYEEAKRSFTEALHLQPGDRTAQDLLHQAEKGHVGSPPTPGQPSPSIARPLPSGPTKEEEERR